MVRRNTPRHYDATARLFHWIAAALVLSLFAIGTYMTGLDFSDWKVGLYTWHESIGLTLFLLTLARLVQRFRRPPPPLPPSAWIEQAAAQASHVALYALLVTLPVVGFLGSNAYGFPVRWFGLVGLPDPIGSNEAVGELLLWAHAMLAWTLAALIAVHIVAALYHYIVRRDSILQRMIPSLRVRRDD
jgi:cytochrome b561